MSLVMRGALCAFSCVPRNYGRHSSLLGARCKHQHAAVATASAVQHDRPHSTPSIAALPKVLDSLCKVYAVRSRPNFFMPWQNKPQQESTGTGFVVNAEERMLLTNAHVVADEVFVMVKRQGSSTKYKATVKAVGHPCDLALLHVEDDNFWTLPTPMVALQFGGVPDLQQEVLVAGYPTGGDTVSITTGVVSRVEMTTYAHGGGQLMAVQIDAAINPGNSGGPALQGDIVVGVAFQNLPDCDNIGYLISMPVVDRFLAEVASHQAYRGFCSLGTHCQTMDNPQLRAAFGMEPDMTGVLITRIQPTMPAARVLRPGDVVLAFDGHAIANDGTVAFRTRERIFCDYLVSSKPIGSTANIQILRDGKKLDVQLEMQVLDPLVATQSWDTLPSYYIYAGFVFTVLTQSYLQEYGDEWYNRAPRSLHDVLQNEMKQRPGQQIVILNQVLVDEINTGYQTLGQLRVLEVNGQQVENLRHLRHLVETSEGPFVMFKLHHNRFMAVDKQDAALAAVRINSTYRIPSMMSSDLLDDAS